MNTSATPLTGSLSVLSAPHPISSTTGGILYNVQPDELDLDIFTNRDLVEFHTELVKNNKLAALEVVLFERFINRVQPATSASPVMGTRNAQANLQAANVQPDDEDAEDLRARNKGAAQADATSRRDKKKKGDKGAKEADRVVALSVQQKAEIASKEYEEHKREMSRAQEEWEKEVDNLKAEMEELDLRVSDIKKDAFDFKRVIATQAVDPRTGKILAEKLLRFYEEKGREKEAVIEKTRLRNATMKAQRNKLQQQLKQKEELGEVLHAIDFDQLTIENAQYQAKIEEKNNELLKLKFSAARTVQVLNANKHKMNKLTEDSNRLQAEIVARKDTLSKLRNESKYVAQEKDKVAGVNQVIQQRMEEYRVPEIMDYVQLKVQVEELQAAEKSWARKLEIQEMAARKLRQQRQQLALPA